MFEAFRERDYRAFWITQFVSNIGSWMQAVAQGWLVYRLTDSAFLLGFVGFAASAPAMVLMLPGGVLADQLHRARIVAISQWAQAASAMWLAVAIWLDRIDVWQIIGAALVVGTAQSFSTPAWQAMVVDLLEDRRNLPNAVAMNSLQFNFSRAIGPVLAGFALTAWGTFWCFFLNAISFMPLIFVLGRVKRHQATVERAGNILNGLRAGFAYVRGDRVVMWLLTAVATGTFFGYPYIQLMPVAARQFFADDRAGNAWLMGAVGAGALIGALYLSIRTPARKVAVIVGSLLVYGLALLTVAFVGRAAIVVVIFGICGLSMVIAFALCATAIQQRVPDEIRGRVMSMYTFAIFAGIPLGSLLAGAVAEQRGLRVALAAMGAGVVATAVATAAALSERRRGRRRSG